MLKIPFPLLRGRKEVGLIYLNELAMGTGVVEARIAGRLECFQRGLSEAAGGGMGHGSILSFLTFPGLAYYGFLDFSHKGAE